MSIKTKAGATALAATLALGLPGAAYAGPGGGGGPRGGDRDAPSRVTTKLRAAERSLDRAQERAEDGESAGAATSLSSVRKNLASALKSAQRRITATGGRAGVASAGAVSKADHRVVSGTAAMFDGADATVGEAAALTLDAALDNRDAVIAAIAALDAETKEDYERVLSRIVDATDDEIEEITEALEDDSLTAEARAALQAALTQLAATKTAAEGQISTASSDDAGYGNEDADYGSGSGSREDCPPRGSRGGNGSGYEDQDTAGSYPQA